MTLIQDFRYAVRALAKARGLTAVVLLTVGIGTGANATVFSFLNALLLRPAPGVREPASLVAVYTSDYSSTPYGDSSYPDYQSLSAETTAFESIAAYQDDAVAVMRVGDVAERIRVMRVSGPYFDLLGIQPVAGRLLTATDVDATAPPTAVISNRFWRRAFGANAAVIGATIDVGGHTHTVIGVAPPGFEGLDLGRAHDLWTPLVAPPATPEERGNRGLGIVARLRDGISIAQAQAQVRTVAERLARVHPDTNMGTLSAPTEPRPMLVLRHTRIGPQFRGDVAMLGSIIMGAVGLVLAIACANVGGLLIARATARSREMAIRVALGAGRARLFRQLLTESLILGVAAGAVGLLLALWTADALPSFFPADQARMLDTSIDWRVIGFTAAVSLVSSGLFGTFPALQATRAPAVAALRGDGGRLSDGALGTRLRRALVVAQVALAVVLLVAASLLVQSLRNALDADLGFGTREAVLASVELPPAEFSDAEGAAYYRAATERVRSLPSVEAASLVRTLPLGGGPRRGFTMEGYQAQPGEDTELHFNVVASGYFETLKMDLRRGRTFDDGDRDGSMRVAIVNESLAGRYFGGHAVGRRLTDSEGRVLHIIGVVGSAKYGTLNEPELPHVYYPLSQSYSPRMTMVVRTATSAAANLETVRRALRDVDSTVAVFRTTTMKAHIDEALTGDRLTATLVSICGAMALVLAIVGIYGMIAYAVVRRSREIGVRVALGASRGQVVRLVLREGVGLTAAGIVLGLAASAAATRLLATMLYGVNPADARTFTMVAAALALTATLAALMPARRALAVDPFTVLRQE